jgi:diguanylate cyclase (GGDEF)-like protein
MTARIISVVDCFDAVREDRQYRKAMTRDEAIELLKTNAGTMYDPRVVVSFIEHLPEFEEEIRAHKAIAANGKREKSSLLRPKPQGADQQVFDQIRNSHGEIETLYSIVQSIGSTLELRDALTIFSTRMQDIISYTTSILYLVRRDTTEVEAIHVSGRHVDAFKGRRMASGAGITGWVVANGHPMHNSDPRLDFDAMKAPVPERYRTSTVVPLLKNGRVLGALAIYSTDMDTYNVDQLRLLEAVAKLMSDAIAKAGNKEPKTTGDLTDKLTGLASSNALRQRFELEADRAERHGENFSIVMMDIDDFKQVNKSLGQDNSDQLLWEVGRLLSKLVQPPNMICRYGGDKFVALLQGDPEDNIEMARQIQRTIDKHDFGFATSNIFIGMSIGYANYGGQVRTLDEMLVQATCAMSADKANRKNVPSGPLAMKSVHLDQYKVM